MTSNTLELRLVKIKEDLGNAKYISEDVFSQERIEVFITGKLRMNYIKLPIESVIYIVTSWRNSDKYIARGGYLHSWRALHQCYETGCLHKKQKQDLVAKYKECFGTEVYFPYTITH